METIIEDDGSSYTTSSSSSQTDTPHDPAETTRPKRKAGRKKFRETRHPVYRGVRVRNGTKWVCEVREPNKKSRIWLGTFSTPEMAARAYDAATLTLRGDNSPLNFTDSVRLIRRAKSSSVRDIQEAALEAALAFGPKCHDSTYKLSSSSSRSFQMEKGDEKMCLETTEEEEVQADTTAFVDEEMLFNMPSFYNSMAEGLVITPPGMKKGFDWSHDFHSNFDSSLWRD